MLIFFNHSNSYKQAKRYDNESIKVVFLSFFDYLLEVLTNLII